MCERVSAQVYNLWKRIYNSHRRKNKRAEPQRTRPPLAKGEMDLQAREVILSLLAGFIVGVLFKWIKLPLPAPPVLAGVMGIVGIWLGGMAADWLRQLWER